MNVQFCRAFAKDLNLTFRGNTSSASFPKGCFRLGSGAFFGTHSTGRGNSSAEPMCMAFDTQSFTKAPTTKAPVSQPTRSPTNGNGQTGAPTVSTEGLKNVFGQKGSNSCPSGSRKMNVQFCRAFAKDLNLTF